MTVLGLWLLGMFMCISMILFVMSNRETRVMALTQKNYKVQLLAENMLEEQRLRIEQNADLRNEILGATGTRMKTLANGEQGEYAYRVNSKLQSGRIVLAVVIWAKNGNKPENMFALQWWLRVDEENGRVILEGIG